MSVTSEEVNYLVYRYLLESGFTHSTFTFQTESAIHKTDIKGATVRPGALINLLQKGLQYVEIENHINEDGTEKKCNVPFSLLTPHICETGPEEDDKEDGKAARKSRKDDSVRRKEDRKGQRFDREKRARKEGPSAGVNADEGPSGNAAAEDMMEMDNAPSGSSKEPPSIMILKGGHSGAVYSTSWNETSSLLASGSHDGSVKVWKIPTSATVDVPSPITLKPAENGETWITAVEWNPPGNLLAAVSSDGHVWIYDAHGNQKFHIQGEHKKLITALKWNKKGDLLGISSMDNVTIMWDPTTGDKRQQYRFHTAAVMDLDWRDDTTIATCSNDKHIYVCQLGTPVPLIGWLAHEDAVNVVKWDPSGKHCASGSDDKTAAVWTTDSQSPVCRLTGHAGSVQSLQWGPSLSEVNARATLFTYSEDGTIRHWTIKRGECIRVIQKESPLLLHCLEIHPSGSYLATAASATGSTEDLAEVYSTKVS
ncbi:hypothetical protein HK097_006910 [Rhizophlyctis rosea]|uniref:Anaphase-promoting complex subunit 4-like WD40 domain-containing protein n=1 Tax=Rhizophlyctis rosea TaxID=64517 RepID=A0AAD5X5K8_9FUNG|nr:hypothetical protein HK097_006910 [Rhizophlyctis rosea]